MPCTIWTGWIENDKCRTSDLMNINVQDIRVRSVLFIFWYVKGKVSECLKIWMDSKNFKIYGQCNPVSLICGFSQHGHIQKKPSSPSRLITKQFKYLFLTWKKVQMEIAFYTNIFKNFNCLFQRTIHYTWELLHHFFLFSKLLKLSS